MWSVKIKYNAQYYGGKPYEVVICDCISKEVAQLCGAGVSEAMNKMHNSTVRYLDQDIPEDVNDYAYEVIYSEGKKLSIEDALKALPTMCSPTPEAIKEILPESNPDEYAAMVASDMWNLCRETMIKNLVEMAHE